MTPWDIRHGLQGPLGSIWRSAGFTLIELLMAVALIAILSAIAYPHYTEYVERSLRADAKAGLSIAAGELERCYTENATYAESECRVTSPSPDRNYTISHAADANLAYIITASLTASRSDGCSADLTLDGQGNRGPPACW